VTDGRRVVAAFDGGAVTSDAGTVLLREADRAIGLIERVAACFTDHREADQVIHALPTLIGQRIVAIALGYEDVNDHNVLRRDPFAGAVLRPAGAEAQGLRAVGGKEHDQPAGARAAGWMLPLPQDRPRRAGAGACLRRCLRGPRTARQPEEIVLDLDASPAPAEGGDRAECR
jgi:hypothetical protein